MWRIHAAYSQTLREAFAVEETAALYKELSRKHGKLKKLDLPRLALPVAIFPGLVRGWYVGSHPSSTSMDRSVD